MTTITALQVSYATPAAPPAAPTRCALDGLTTASALELYRERLAPTTRRTYERAFNLFENTTGTTIQEATIQHVSKFIGWMDTQGYKPGTQGTYLSGISGLMQRHVYCGTRKVNAVLALNKIKRINKIGEKGATLRIEIADLQKIKNDRTGLIIRSLFYTGCRVSELINIKYTDLIDCNKNGLAYKQVCIIGKGKKQRTVYLPTDLHNEIRKAYNMPGSEYLFHTCKAWTCKRTGRTIDHRGGLLSRTNVYQQIRIKFRKWTGKDKIGPHQIRHLLATDKIVTEKQNLKSVSLYLGHSSVKTTCDIYVSVKAAPEMILTRRI